MKLKTRAFTLVEILLVSVLISVVGLAIFRCFINGLKLWSKAQRLNNEAEVVIFLDKIAEDLRSVVVLSGLSFKGNATQISFPAVVMTKADSKSSRASEGLINQIGSVKYRYDFDKHTIYRQQANYPQAIKDRWKQDELPVVSGVDELVFHYEIVSENRLLLKSDISEKTPAGIMVEIRFSDQEGQHEIKRYIPIPVGA